MECKIKNDIGTIYITEDVMLKVVGYAALECYGIVAMSSKRAKDGLVQWLGRENLSKGVQLRLVDDMLDVDLFINTGFPSPRSARPSCRPCAISWKA